MLFGSIEGFNFMQNSIKILRLWPALLGLSLGLVSFAVADESKALKVEGSATIALKGAPAMPLAANGAIPEGATVATAEGAKLSVEVMPGVVAAFQPGTIAEVEKISSSKNGDTVIDQSATLNIKQGKIVTTIDPAKMGITTFGIRTLKGLATARSAVFAVTQDVKGSSVATLSGTVTIDYGVGEPVIIPIGSVSSNGAASQPLADAIRANPELAKDIAEAVTTVAANVASGFSALGSPEASTAILASVVKVASEAVPSLAATFAQQAVQAIASPTSAVSTSGSNAGAAIAAITEAAASGSRTSAAAVTTPSALPPVTPPVSQPVSR